MIRPLKQELGIPTSEVIARRECRSVWKGFGRPAPAELRTAEYDSEASSLHCQKLVVCTPPRTSSKRLARLLLAAGFGVPMEYFNPNQYATMVARWNIRKSEYLHGLYQIRSANAVFATNIMHHQIRSWPYQRDIDELFDGAMVIYLTRQDRTAQAISLAACMVTGNWGFAAEHPQGDHSDRFLRKAVRRAVRLLDEEYRQWPEFFFDRKLTPMAITSERVNQNDLRLIEEISDRLSLHFDVASTEKMLLIDNGPYAVDRGLKERLRPMVQEIRKAE